MGQTSRQAPHRLEAWGKSLASFRPTRVGETSAPMGPGVNPAVGVATNLAIDRADVQARAAADAVQSFAHLRVGQQSGAAIVDQDKVKFLGAVLVIGPGGGR